MKVIAVSVLVIFGITGSLGGAGISSFSRACTKNSDCNFANAQAKSSKVFLPCEQGNCKCGQHSGMWMMDVSFYSVEAKDGKCVVKGKAPCGTANGITLYCDAGRKCVEGRCRTDGEVKSTPIRNRCDETVDCQDGLVCKLGSGFSATFTCAKA